MPHVQVVTYLMSDDLCRVAVASEVLVDVGPGSFLSRAGGCNPGDANHSRAVVLVGKQGVGVDVGKTTVTRLSVDI